jgi:hypothetical protein
MAGFALATALLHGIGIAAVLGFGVKFRSLVRAARAMRADSNPLITVHTVGGEGP